jgi:hypothetical protein
MDEGTVHFEGHGNHWDAVEDFGGSAGLMPVIQKTATEGTLSKDTVLKPVIPIVYPANNPIQSCVLEYIDETKNVLEVMSFYPFMEGISTKLILTDKYTWENEIEGEVSGTFCDRIEIPFFAPFYYCQFLNLELGKEYTVFLAGLAYSVENDTGRTFEIKQGPLYEMQLKEFLKENPSKTENDYPATIVSMDGCATFIQQKYFAEIEYRGPILELTETNMFDIKIFKAKICVARVSEYGECGDLIINLYMSEKVLNGYNPKVGDDIMGVMWLTGYLKIQKNVT